MFIPASLFVFLASALLPLTFAATQVTQLNIINEAISPDGYSRSAVVVNGVTPGPLIKGNKGDNFRINVSNNLTDSSMERSTSIHWHGIFQDKGTNYNDGSAFVTQCPIVPGNAYEYDFPVLDQAGTFWYHSHVSTQYCDGLRGPFVVYDPNDPYAHMYDVDNESTIITLADWYHQPSPKVVLPPVANSTLINGLGRYVGGPASPLSVINVNPGKRYRFRLLSMACDSSFNFSIDGHRMTIIEADGEPTLPLQVDFIQIFAGQRYSFILQANQTVNNYWIRAEQQTGINGGPTGFADGINSAILRYAGAPNADPTTNQTDSVIPLYEGNLHPLSNPAAPGKPYVGGADVLLNLEFTLNDSTLSINGVAYKPPSVPVLLQILNGAKTAADLLPTGSIYVLPPNKVIEISMVDNAQVGPWHPFHLHGHAFSVVRTAGTSHYNYVNPVRRDVVSIGQFGDNVTIRFVTDNTGPWFLHWRVLSLHSKC
ncbi:laccase [Piloderma croceum F 1598]|uniref:Laccase n=1 Tax=Piloderma croceum (strain F 1598) TaxID=765440 RepID=A0A0C3BED2_PILCF|nr:laccase [Piloderma croceum F 1598]